MRTPTRSSSRPLSVRSGLSRTPSKVINSPAPISIQSSNDIPIDPALLEDEENDMDDMEDAEGELVDDELDLIPYGRDERYLTSHSNPVYSSSSTPNPYLPTKLPRIGIFSSSSQQSITPINYENEGSPRKRARIARSSTSRSTPQLNGESYTQDHNQNQYDTPFQNKTILTPSLVKSRSSSSSVLIKGIKSKPSKSEQSGGEISYKSNTGKGKGKNINIKGLCSYCGGTNLINRQHQPEKMLTCTKCGRSGHPSCLQIDPNIIETITSSKNWECIECKTCQICKVKGDDSRLLFCDSCDTGWHSFCLRPQLAKPPKGLWHCPRCISAKSNIPSTSRSVPAIPVTTSSRKGKGKATASMMDMVSTPTARPRKSIKSTALNGDEDNIYEEELPLSRIKVKVPKRDPDKSKSTSSARKRHKGDNTEDEGTPMIVRLRLPNNTTPKGGQESAEREIPEEEKVEPYGGIITGKEADTSKTEITDRDKEDYEKSRRLAENRLGGPPPAANLDPILSNSLSIPNSPMNSPGPSNHMKIARGGSPLQTPGRSTPISSSKLNGTASTPSISSSAQRPLRDRLLQQSVSDSPGFPFPPSSSSNNISPQQNSLTPISHHGHHHPSAFQLGGTGKPEKINKIRFGQFDIDTWYSAPYPEEYAHVPDGRLWLCEFCLKYMKSGFVAGRHRLKCKVRHPPGDEIYRDGSVSVFEVDGRKNKIYCQNLCLLAKMFLDHKTLYYDVEPFLFYVMTEVDDLGARFVGYFSKEKRSMDNNVSCIMTLPVRQRKGWGQLLIDFSYALSKKENRVGSPEKPLSGLGAVTYKGYWRLTVFRYLLTAPPNVTMENISSATSITLEDIYSVLTSEDMINTFDTPSLSQTPVSNSKMSKSRNRARGGNGGSNRRKPLNNNDDDEDDKVKLPKRYEIIIDKEYIQAVLKKHDEKGYLVLRPERLKYHPFLVTRNPNATEEERVKATLTIIDHQNQRKEEEEEDSSSPTEEDVIKGKDKATLNLIAELTANEQSPARHLRRKRDNVNYDLDQEEDHDNDDDDDDDDELDPKGNHISVSPTKQTKKSIRSVNGKVNHINNNNISTVNNSIDNGNNDDYDDLNSLSSSSSSSSTRKNHNDDHSNRRSLKPSSTLPNTISVKANGKTIISPMKKQELKPTSSLNGLNHLHNVKHKKPISSSSSLLSISRRKRIILSSDNESEEEEEQEEVEQIEHDKPIAKSSTKLDDGVQNNNNIASTNGLNGDKYQLKLSSSDNPVIHDKLAKSQNGKTTAELAQAAHRGSVDIVTAKSQGNDDDEDEDALGEDEDAEGEDEDAEGEDDDEYMG